MIRLQICTYLIVRVYILSTLLLLCQRDIKMPPSPLGSNFKFSCSFKVFTVEKKYTEIAFPGFVYGLSSVSSTVELKRFQEVLASLFSGVFDPAFDGQR